MLEDGDEPLESAARFLDALIGYGVLQAGEHLDEHLANLRLKNKVRLLMKAKALLEAQGAGAPRAVLPKIAIPILEAGSLEADGEMRRRWAALLANAASPASAEPVLPVYAEMLKQLMPVQAHMLDLMYEQKVEVGAYEYSWQDVTRDEVLKYFDIREAEYTLLASDLRRLGLIDGRGNASGDDWASDQMYLAIGLTSLGLHFVRACRPPTGSPVGTRL